MSESVRIDDLMKESGVKFGTSGARGLVTQMTDRVCVAYTLGFLSYLQEERGLSQVSSVAISGDLRPSTPTIARAIAFAARHLGLDVEFCGWVPSPALALRGLESKMPALMVTGSHIPDDRNGIKFNTPEGEITKKDEEGVRAREVCLPDVFDSEGMFRADPAVDERKGLPPASADALESFRSRYLDSFPKECLAGMRVGVYGHSAVGRDFLVELYEAMGAQVVRLGFSEKFIPVDTEAIRPEDMALGLKWAKEHELTAIVSTDGDSDRPLISDEKGAWIRGDVAGIVTAQFLGATHVATPVSCNTAVEKCGSFTQVLRTRIGSPYVISAMAEATNSGAAAVVGYEANGGFLTASDLQVPGGARLKALPTRDAVIVHLALLLSARSSGVPLSALFQKLPQRFTASNRDQGFEATRSQALLGQLSEMTAEQLEATLGLGPVVGVDRTDGLRFTFDSQEVLHFRPSGNAPELRAYAEADSEQRALSLVAQGLKLAGRLAP